MQKAIDFLKNQGSSSFYTDEQNIYALDIPIDSVMQCVYRVSGLGGGGAVWDAVQGRVLMISCHVPKEMYFFSVAAEPLSSRHNNPLHLKRLQCEKIPLIFEPKNAAQCRTLFDISSCILEGDSDNPIQIIENINNLIHTDKNIYQVLINTDDFSAIDSVSEQDTLIATYCKMVRIVPYLPHRSTQVFKPFFLK